MRNLNLINAACNPIGIGERVKCTGDLVLDICTAYGPGGEYSIRLGDLILVDGLPADQSALIRALDLCDTAMNEHTSFDSKINDYQKLTAFCTADGLYDWLCDTP